MPKNGLAIQKSTHAAFVNSSSCCTFTFTYRTEKSPASRRLFAEDESLTSEEHQRARDTPRCDERVSEETVSSKEESQGHDDVKDLLCDRYAHRTSSSLFLLLFVSVSLLSLISLYFVSLALLALCYTSPPPLSLFLRLRRSAYLSISV